VRTSPHTTVVRLLVAAFLAVFLLGGATCAVAAPTNAAIEDKRAEAEAAGQKLDQLNTDVELRFEELSQIEDAVEKTRRQISGAERDLEQATKDVSRSESLLNRRAMNIYRTGAVDMVAVFVGATDFQDFVARIDLMRRVGRSDASLVASVKDARIRVETAKRALETREAEQLTLREQARRKQDQVLAAQEAQSKYLATLKTELKKLIETERLRQEKLAAARAKALAAAQRAAANANRGKVLPFDPAKLGSPRKDVVEIAKEYLKVPYVWGGTSPAGFDCSGLMQYCYAKIGISLPRTSRTQFHAGAYIPPNRLDLLEPGDMVFFGIGGDPDQIHHVGMYVGSGDFIHAPATGDVVRITSLNGRIASKGDYVGACRP
jgi:cell wall-associated NlpC family hydrolase/outer membrane murein-binding lipoprotein Lpp